MSIRDAWTMAALALPLALVLATTAVARDDPSSTTTPRLVPDPLLADPHSGHHPDANPAGVVPTRPPGSGEGLGTVEFPVTSLDPRVQPLINQGVAHLHALWPAEADRCFREATLIDPKCAMAWWGRAMANLGDEEVAGGYLGIARARRYAPPAVSTREARYIDALYDYLEAGPERDRERRLAYVEALEGILAEDPTDRVARGFLARQLWSNHEAGLPIGSLAAVDALLRLNLAEGRDHPSQVDRLRLWAEARPAAALDTAARCGPLVPESPQMWHMPGHIYARLGRRDEALWHYEAALRRFVDYATDENLDPDAIPGLAHDAECLARTLADLGRAGDALATADTMLAWPRHPLTNRPGLPGGSSARGRALALDLLARFEMWHDLIRRTSDGGDLGPDGEPIDEARRLRLLGRAAFATGDEAAGRARIDDLKALAATLADEDDRAAALEFEHALAELNGHLAIAAGKLDDGLALLESPGGPDPFFRAHLLARAGRYDEAENLASAEADRLGRDPLSLAHLVAIRWDSDRLQEAEQAFTALREVSGGLDLEALPFARLAPISKRLGYPDDWRMGRPAPATAGSWLPLDDLGPARWEPPSAPSWTLPDDAGTLHALHDYRDGPVLLIFYLGASCLHCVEQLNAFAPRFDEFKSLNVPMIGVSTDGPEKLRDAVRTYGGDGFPFPLVSDAPLEIFRRYGAFDESTGQPMHGTFLIDAGGIIRFRDIGPEPFMEVDFVLDEARRLELKAGSGQGPAAEVAGAHADRPS